MNSDLIYHFICNYSSYEESYRNYKSLKNGIILFVILLFILIPIFLVFPHFQYSKILEIGWLIGSISSIYTSHKILSQGIDYLFEYSKSTLFQKYMIFNRLSKAYINGVKTICSVGSENYKDDLIKKLSFY